MAVLIKYLLDLNQKNHGSFILDTEGAGRRESRSGVRLGTCGSTITHRVHNCS